MVLKVRIIFISREGSFGLPQLLNCKEAVCTGTLNEIFSHLVLVIHSYAK